MENNNSRSTSNLNQRLQVVAERRAQIEEAKRERVQRQIEQVARTAPPPLPGVSQNPSVAFGSTRPRNIDLTRPLVNPIPSARPKSEIFPSSFGYSAGAGGGHSVTDSPAAPVYSKDDANYHHQSRASRAAAALHQSPSMTQSMSVSSIQPASSGGTTFRAVRRHDPELVPAMQKYMFREYAMPNGTPSTGTPVMRKENSLMTASMTSTKSFQASSFIYRTPFGGPGARPKKSFSMNRLDQLAQPRRRVEPKVPTSASFIKTREPLFLASKKPTSASSDATETPNRGMKPVPPPKTLFKASSKPVPNESGSITKPAITPRPRPLSQIEPLSKAAAKLVDSSPVFVPSKPTPQAPVPTPSQTPAPASAPAIAPVPSEEDNNDESNGADKLAEYKRALAEKKAMYRKQQEEKPQVPARRAVIVKPEPINTKQDDDKSNHSSSSSSSSSDSEDEAPKSTEVVPPSETSVPTETVVESVSEIVSDSPQQSQTEQLISIEEYNNLPKTEFIPKPIASENLMTTSLTGDLASLSVSDDDKLLANASMTASFDASLLTSSTANSNAANTNSPSGQRPGSLTLTKEQLEERSAMLLQQERAEREKRKSRVQEILKRTTRKDEKKEENSKSGGNSPTNLDDQVDENSSPENSSSENSSPENGSTENGALVDLVQQNGTATANGHSKYNGMNGVNGEAANGKVESNGINSNHHRDMKTFVSENEQSLPPTNGF